jgi:hypothetical protein
MFFAVLADARQIERNYIREKALEGQAAAAAKGHHGGRPKVIDDDRSPSPRAQGQRRPGPGHRQEAHHQDRKERGQPPSVASRYRGLAEAEQAAADDDLAQLRPEPARIRHADEPLTVEEAALRDRVQDQVLQRSAEMR